MVVEGSRVSNFHSKAAVTDSTWYVVYIFGHPASCSRCEYSVTSPPTALRRAFAGRRRSLAHLGGVTLAFGLVAASLLMFRVTAGSSPCPMLGAIAASSSAAVTPASRGYMVIEARMRVAVPTIHAAVRGTTLSEMSVDDGDCAAGCNLPQECTCPCHGTCACMVGHSAAVLAALSPHVAVLSATRRTRPIVHVDRAPQSREREPALRPPIA